jgi:pimeloyl-ACP methyl ester carboxylesterase
MRVHAISVGAAVFGLLAGCGLDLDPAPPIIHARFDPDAKVIPMPTDVLRDDVAGHLDIPIDDTLTPAEAELSGWMNTMDGWSSASSATVELTGAIDADTVQAGSLQVWHWDETPELVEGVTVTVAADDQSIEITAPRTGWERGGRYVVVMRGGATGIDGKDGEKVECDAAFYFLRQTERLDTPEHERAFPGDTRAERQENARKLEKIREDLAPMFDFFEARDLPRADVAALWSFTVTTKVELAMDEASQRMPLPIDLLLDPASGKIDLPAAAWDSATVVDAKAALAAYDGFGTSMGLTFGFTGPIDPATVTDANVELWRLTEGAAPVREPVMLALLADGINVEITPTAQPLPEQTTFAVVVRDGIHDVDGQPIALMPAGRLMQAHAPVFVDGKSQVGPVRDEAAEKLERVRADTVGFLDDIDAAASGTVLASWTYTTMSVDAPIQAWIDQPATLNVAKDPAGVQHLTPAQALADFPLAIGSLFYVGDVYTGTIESPVFLDPETRAFRSDGGHEVQDIAFTMTMPRNLPAGAAVPVVIFGHAIMTERRMVLAIGDALAQRGFAAIAIDLPMHGTRTYCWSEGPLSVPNPSTGQLTPLTQPCATGASCSDDGRCVDATGATQPFNAWPILDMPMASGAAFLEIEKIANTRDHFIQSEIDLSALLRSLREGDWQTAIGHPIDTTEIDYAGQSLGGVLGGTFVALHPEIGTAVLNVPGGDTVDMFKNSPFFGGQVSAFFTREGVDPESYDGHRFLNVARWFMDTADPASFARRLTLDRDDLLQMATLDAIIPNDYTKTLETLSGAPRRDYVAEHAFLVIPIEPEYGRGTREMAQFLSGEFRP